jgi:hypothetical protein
LTTPCEQLRCVREAEYRVYWPGQTMVLCQPHTLQAIELASHRGFKLTTARLGTLFEWVLQRKGGPQS